MNILKKIIKKLYSRFALLGCDVGDKCEIRLFAFIKNTKLEGANVINKSSYVVNSEIGYASYIGKNSILMFTKIGRYCSIASDFSIIQGIHPTRKWVSTHPSFFSKTKLIPISYTNENKFNELKFTSNENKYYVEIGNDVWVASKVTVLPGVVIGDGAIVAAGSIVTKDVPPYAIVAGVPAKVIGYRFSEDEIQWLQKLEWWNKDTKWINYYARYFENIKLLKDKLGN